jgi:hypothetical protein
MVFDRVNRFDYGCHLVRTCFPMRVFSVEPSQVVVWVLLAHFASWKVLGKQVAFIIILLGEKPLNRSRVFCPPSALVEMVDSHSNRSPKTIKSLRQ